jgi:hypothetical protein
MGQYRKIPVVVEARRFTGENAGELSDWTDKRFHDVPPEDREEDPDIVAEVFDVLHSTWVGVKTGQWIIRGVQGEFYPIDEAVFAATYEAV